MTDEGWDELHQELDECPYWLEKSGSGNRSTAERESMAGKGQAMAGGRYPIGNEDELHKAVKAVGRGKGSHDAIRKHIVSRARSMGLSSAIPNAWQGAANPRKAELELEVAIWKDETKHVVYGVVLEPNLRDSQGDIVTPPEIEKAAHNYLAESRLSDRQHSEQAAMVDVIESYVAPHDMVVAGQAVQKGAWVMATKIKDDSLWQDIVEGKLTGYSIGGSAIRIPD